MTEERHSWTEQELWVVSVCYKENLPVDLALRLTKTTNKKSMEMRYQNCLFLDKGKVENSLSHPSKKHVEVWEDIENMYSGIEPLKKEEVPKKEEVNLDFIFGLVLFVIIASNIRYILRILG